MPYSADLQPQSFGRWLRAAAATALPPRPLTAVFLLSIAACAVPLQGTSDHLPEEAAHVLLQLLWRAAKG